jgi:hypothetical protein
MSTDTVNSKEKTGRDITWNALIEHAEAEILACREKIKALRKSCIFFKKQSNSGVPYPIAETVNPGKHPELS